ncbi:MAG: hypothetical protein HFI11_08020 [Lachnospiraceae bacterium]|nr:hypothetical protein [Lachnospiraceae bacterium]
MRDGRAFSAEFLFSGSTVKTRCQGRAGDFTPCCFSEVPGLFRNHLPVDTAIIIATPPDKDGFYRRLQRMPFCEIYIGEYCERRIFQIYGSDERCEDGRRGKR